MVGTSADGRGGRSVDRNPRVRAVVAPYGNVHSVCGLKSLCGLAVLSLRNSVAICGTVRSEDGAIGGRGDKAHGRPGFGGIANPSTVLRPLYCAR